MVSQYSFDIFNLICVCAKVVLEAEELDSHWRIRQAAADQLLHRTLPVDLTLDVPRDKQVLQSPLLFQILTAEISCCLLKRRGKPYQEGHSQPWEIIQFPSHVALHLSVEIQEILTQVPEEQEKCCRFQVQFGGSSAEITRMSTCKVYKNYSINVCNGMEMVFLVTVFETFWRVKYMILDRTVSANTFRVRQFFCLGPNCKW